MTGNDGRERLPEVGGILHLEHFNFEMLEHDMATIFFMNGLGLTRDPFRRADENNMGVNIGLQQFHLPRRGRATPPFYGEIGLVVPDIKVIKARLNRLKNIGRFDGSQFEMLSAGRGYLQVRSPWGVCLRLLAAGKIPFQRPLGLVYVDIPVAPGKAEPIAGFYRSVMNAPATVRKMNGEVTAVVTMGPFQEVRFRERELDDHNLYDFHIAYYISNYNQIRDQAIAADCLQGDGMEQLFFFAGPFDPESGEVILQFVQEARSIYHPDYMRPLVNRWPITSEPYSHQADILADLANVPGLNVPS